MVDLLPIHRQEKLVTGLSCGRGVRKAPTGWLATPCGPWASTHMQAGVCGRKDSRTCAADASHR